MFKMSCRLGVFRRAFHASRSRYEMSKTTESNSFSELRAEIQTCGELYEKWRKENRYWKIPKGSLSFTITYIDTSAGRQGGGNIGPDNPVALALHGAPGSYRDFGSLTSHLHQNGVRVVIPKLPDFTAYRPGIFRHSTEEKAQLIKDFLKEINISKIDLLICHSSSIYPALRLCVENHLPTVQSLIMLNPGAYSIMRATRPYIPLYAMVRLSEFSVGLKFLEFIGVYLLKHIKAPVRLENLMDPLLSATTMCFADFPQAKENLKTVSSQNLPILFAFGENDKLIDKHLSYDMAYLLGANNSDIFYYDEKGKLLRTGVEKPFLKVMAFKEGSHYVFWKHPEIINEAVVSFMLKILKQQR